MLMDISGVKIKGGVFVDNEFNFFCYNNNEANMAIIYGKNGSGKSTIARAFRKIKGEDTADIDNASVINKDGIEIKLDSSEKKNIYVFDEKFVNDEIKLKEEGIDTIVLIGQKKELSDRIDACKNNLIKYNTDFEKQEDKVKQYYDAKVENSISDLSIKMQVKLSGDSNWAGRDRIIKSNRRNTSVNEKTFEEFINRKPNKTRDELLIDFNHKLNELENMRNKSNLISQEVKMIDKCYDDKLINELLEKKIVEPNLSEREKYLLNLLKKGRKDYLDEILQAFKYDDKDFCPFCLRDIDKNYKNSIIEIVENILEEELKKHLNLLEKSIWEPLNVDLSSFDKIPIEKKNCEDIIKNINERLEYNNSKLKIKIGNPYIPIKCEKSNINDMICELNKSLENLENKRKKYNEEASNLSQRQHELEEINNDIAYYDIIDIYNDYVNKHKEYDDERKILENKKMTRDDEQNILNDLIAEEKSINIAVDEINKHLEYVFLSNSRMKIECKDNEYKILVNNKPVRPSQISVGERNILGLCYFFTKILNDKINSYSDTCLIIIDDPISSFDFENRIGIMSFLRYITEEILLDNNESKILILTHDLLSVYDLHRSMEKFTEYKNKYKKDFVFCDLELSRGMISDFRYKKRQEYTELLIIVYNYAIRKDINLYDLIIGNIIRQVLEAFTTFLFKSGIDVINDVSIMQDFPNDKCKKYFKNLMARLILHGGSHREEQIKSIKDVNLFSCASTEEKIKIAQDILCFLYLINKQHILAHLGNNVEENIEEWVTSLC